MTHTRFKGSYRKKGPAVPGSRVYEATSHRYWVLLNGLAKEKRYRMETSNKYMERDNVLIHVIEHDIVLTLDIIFEHIGNR